jgi:hypothetical protein
VEHGELMLQVVLQQEGPHLGHGAPGLVEAPLLDEAGEAVASL